MNELIEYGEIAVSFVSRNFSKISEISKPMVRSVKNEPKIKKSYATYIQNVEKRYGKAKSFFIRSEPTDIYEFYVPVSVLHGDSRIERVTFQSISETTNRVVVSAPAGAGKSMLLRHFLLDSLKNSDRMPIFIELRNVEKTGDAIEKALLSTLRTHEPCNFKAKTGNCMNSLREGDDCFDCCVGSDTCEAESAIR